MVEHVQEAKGELIFRLHRPFFDLEPVAEAPLSSIVPLFAYEDLSQESGNANGLQRYATERFRFSLLAESGLSQYARFSPLEVQEAYRTIQWQHLCDLTESFSGLSAPMQVLLLRLLLALCFNRLILKLVPATIISNLKDEDTASKAFIRALALSDHHSNESNYYIRTMEEIIRQRPVDSEIRHFALMKLLVYSAKECKDLQATSYYRSMALPYLSAQYHDQSSFTYHMLKSRFFRAASFEPFLQKNYTRLGHEMDNAEYLARTAPLHTEPEYYIAQENLYSVLESRMREAISTGDLDLAQARMEENTRINPLDVKTHIEMGEVFMRQGKTTEAAAEYTRASQLSPPGSALANYMAGYCYEHLDDLDRAIDFYLASLQADAKGISSLQGLLRLSIRTGKKDLQHWIEQKVEELAKSGYAV